MMSFATFVSVFALAALAVAGVAAAREPVSWAEAGAIKERFDEAFFFDAEMGEYVSTTSLTTMAVATLRKHNHESYTRLAAIRPDEKVIEVGFAHNYPSHLSFPNSYEGMRVLYFYDGNNAYNTPGALAPRLGVRSGEEEEESEECAGLRRGGGDDDDDAERDERKPRRRYVNVRSGHTTTGSSEGGSGNCSRIGGDVCGRRTAALVAGGAGLAVAGAAAALAAPTLSRKYKERYGGDNAPKFLKKATSVLSFGGKK